MGLLDTIPGDTTKDNLGQVLGEQVNSIIELQETIGNNVAVEFEAAKFELEEYKRILKSTNKYKIVDNKLVYTAKGSNIVSNFLMIPILKNTYLNVKNPSYILKAFYLEDYTINLPNIEVTAAELNTGKFLIGCEWDKYCILEYGNSNYAKLREVAQLIGRYTMKEQKVYTETGFVLINNKKMYLLHGGAISEKGEEKNIKSDLSSEELKQYCFTSNECDKKDAIRTSFSILDLADRSITIPLLTSTYLGPLVSLFEEIGINIDYVLFLVGKPQTRKSSTCAVMLSHFGPGFNKDNLPASFKDSITRLERKSHILGDTVIVINDFNKETVGNNKLKLLEQVFEIFGDKQSCGRANPNGTARKNYRARCLAIINGEIIPSNLSESRLARSVILHLEQDTINLEVLTVLQENQYKLSVAMKEYIHWVILNENKIKEKALEMFKKFRNSQKNNLFGRTNDAINVMLIGFRIFLEFLKDNEIINEEQLTEWNEHAKVKLSQLLEHEKDIVENVDPVNMFYAAVDELFQTDKIYVLDYADGQAIIGYSKGERVGYIDKKEGYYYFYETTIYNKINSFYGGKNGDFPLSKLDLWRQLDNKGLLFRNDPSRYQIQRRNPITHDKESVIAVKIKNYNQNYHQEQMQQQAQTQQLEN